MSVTPIAENRVHEDIRLQWMSGIILSTENDSYLVQDSDNKRRIKAKKAVSCLLKPLAGDYVVYMASGRDDYYITTILERDIHESSVYPDAEISYPGNLKIEAESILSMGAGNKLNLHAKEMTSNIDKVTWISRSFDFLSESLSAKINTTTRFTSKVFDLLSRTMRVSAERSYKTVNEADHHRVGVYDLKAEEMANIRARCTIVKGKELVKVDSSQINIG